MIEIDGASGEGGGQVLRTALGLSMATGRAFRIQNIRAGRKTPGLRRQHLTSVETAAQLCGATVTGAALGSLEVEFIPGPVVAGEALFDIGSAGSTTLVFQAVLPGLIGAPGPVSLVVRGGTHNPMAPTFGFIQRTFLPRLAELGIHVEAELVRPGFFPGGGGEVRFRVLPSSGLRQVSWLERGTVRRWGVRILLAAHKPAWAEPGVEVLRRRLGLEGSRLEVVSMDASRGPGNVFELEVESDFGIQVFTAIAERDQSPSDTATRLVNEAQRWLIAGVPVDEHLADQLLLPLALAGGGTFRSTPPSTHSETQARTVETFLPVEVRFETESESVSRITVAPRESLSAV